MQLELVLLIVNFVFKKEKKINSLKIIASSTILYTQLIIIIINNIGRF